MRQPRTPSTSVGVARAWRLALSEPTSGSVTPIATSTSPEASFGSHSSFCASVPPVCSAWARISGRVCSDPAAPSEAADSSSVITTIGR